MDVSFSMSKFSWYLHLLKAALLCCNSYVVITQLLQTNYTAKLRRRRWGPFYLDNDVKMFLHQGT